jgi:hypothetical protein
MLLATLLSCTLPVDQRPSCARYVECLAARDDRDGTSTDVKRFLPDGDCWGNATGADLCDRACTAGLDWLAEREPDLAPACRP